MNLESGEFAVKLARKTIETWVKNNEKLGRPKDVPKGFMEKSGVFTTLHTYPERGLRGCIGLPYPDKPLVEAIMESAMSVTRDPRFPELRPEELDKVIVEVSVLTKSEEIKVEKPEDYLKKIDLGKDGLIIKFGFQSGLLLPQVPVEQKWDIKTFLENLCFKAGLPQETWTYEDCEIRKFQTEIFSEKEPGGKIEKV